MERYITPFVTDAEIVRAVPDEASISIDTLPFPVLHFTPKGLARGILICGSSSRTRLLIERIYGSVQELDTGSASNRGPILLIKEGDHAPSFVVDRANMVMAISGPIVTVAQLKISLRYLTACTALRETTLLTPVHGCLISRNGLTLLISGSSGSGKSWMSKNFVKRGSKLLVDDWALYDPISQLCIREDEWPVVRRGADPPPTFPPWTIIECFNGDPLSPQSRYIALDSEMDTVHNESIRVTHLLILDDPYALNIELRQQRNIGFAMQQMHPRFTDEALNILGPIDSETLAARLDMFGASLDSRRLIGYRTSAAHYQQAISLISAWIEFYE